MTRVKICGITCQEDAEIAIESGADALGFIFVPETPRYVGAFPGALDVARSLPPFVQRVAVCRSLSDLPAEHAASFDAIQFYSRPDGAEPPAGKRLIQAFRIRDESSLEEIAASLQAFRPHALHLDAYHKDKLGGSGETFNWQLAVAAKARFGLPVILAGGLTPENVGEAIAAARPYAVDVSSGVEAAPGRKDPAKLQAFLRAVRDAMLRFSGRDHHPRDA